MKDWDYDGVWKTFGAASNQVWKAGDNTLVIRDLFDVSIDEVPKSGMEYSDPPWNIGNMHSFYTKASIPWRGSFSALMSHIIALSINLDPVYLECSLKDIPAVIQLMKSLWTDSQGWPVTYYGKFPSGLVRAWRKGSALLEDQFVGADDIDTPLKAIQTEKPTLVIDFCTGKGGTARRAYECNLPFWGVELNPKRAAHLLKFWKEHGMNPERIA